MYKTIFFVQEISHELGNLEKIEIDFHKENSYDFDSVNENFVSISGEHQHVEQAPVVNVPTLPICKFVFKAFLMIL